MTIEVGALEQSYCDAEAAYAASAGSGGAALAATDGIRHLELTLSAKNNREPSPEKRGTPDVQQMLPTRKSYSFNLSSIMWEPSGTLGTISNVGKFLEAAFGSVHTISSGLATTVAAIPAPTETGFTLADSTGLAVGDVFAVTIGGVREISRVLTLPGSDALTCDELSAAPSAGAAFISGSTFKLTSSITKSLSVYKYYNAGGYKQAVYGAVVNQAQLTFDGTRPVSLSFQGPAGRYADSDTTDDSPNSAPPQAAPGAHTTVGAPASGLVGNFFVDQTAFPVISCQVTLNNNLELRNKELGTQYASGIAGRSALRQVQVRITFYLEDRTLMAKAGTVTTGMLRFAVGDTNGSIVAIVMPKVEFEIPDVGNEIGPKEITIDGVALATSGNDQVFAAEL